MGTGQLSQGQIRPGIIKAALEQFYQDLSILMFNDRWILVNTKHSNIDLCVGLSWPRRYYGLFPLCTVCTIYFPHVPTPRVSASVLLAAASYSDNNAIIEGLASSRCLVTIHNMGLALKRILRLNKNILLIIKARYSNRNTICFCVFC